MLLGATVRLCRLVHRRLRADPPEEVLAHICARHDSAIDYKDNDKLLEDAVNHMAANTLRPEGVCVKLVTRPGENLPGVFVEDRNRNVLHTTMLGNEHESHFDARCHECVLP